MGLTVNLDESSLGEKQPSSGQVGLDNAERLVSEDPESDQNGNGALSEGGCTEGKHECAQEDIEWSNSASDPSTRVSTTQSNKGPEEDLPSRTTTAQSRRRVSTTLSNGEDDSCESQEIYEHHTLRVSHLEKFKLPDSYPQNVADIIRANSLEEGLLDTLCPKLTQTLCIR